MNIFKSIVCVIGLIFSGASLAEKYYKTSLTLTAYTSRPAETDSTPRITATGTSTRLGVVAVSRDILRVIGYNNSKKSVTMTIQKIYPSIGCNPIKLPTKIIFVVEDTMHPRWIQKADLWTSSYRDAIQFGKCKADVLFSYS